MRDGLAGCERKNPAEKLRRVFGAPGGIRTPDTLLKRQVLCRLSYWGIKIGWDGGARTHNTGVKVPCVTVTPHPTIQASPLRKLPPQRREKYGVGDGTRTHGIRNHNPALYQLSYTHHIFCGPPRRPRCRPRAEARESPA